MDISKLREGKKLLAELDKLNNKKCVYANYNFRVAIGAENLDIAKEEEEAVRKIFTEKLDAQIAEIERKIAEL